MNKDASKLKHVYKVKISKLPVYTVKTCTYSKVSLVTQFSYFSEAFYNNRQVLLP